MATMTHLAMQPVVPHSAVLQARRMCFVSQALPLRLAGIRSPRRAAPQPLAAAVNKHGSPARLDNAEAGAVPAVHDAQHLAQPQAEAVSTAKDREKDWPWWQFGILLAKGALIVVMAAALVGADARFCLA